MPNDTSLKENDEFLIKLVPSTADYCKDLLNQVIDSFFYKPDLHSIINAALITGSFSSSDVAQNIRASFVSQINSSTKPFLACLSSQALDICKLHQKSLRPLFRYKPDIHMVANALLVTGKYDYNLLTSHIREAFSNPSFTDTSTNEASA
ncbi:MAG: hypothetical protein JNM06_22405 [Blastocatellia bacterium]|nr:hypothetical protein [Blastocatellia bacterium]